MGTYRFQLGDPLTPREFQSAWLYASGLSLKQVAFRLGVTRFTVAHHIKVAYVKLGVHSIWELVFRFERDGAL